MSLVIPGVGRTIPVGPDFRRRIPERVIDSGRIFRAIDGLEDLYQTKGSGASPEMLRTEMGVIYVHDLQAVLATQVAELDAVAVSVTTAGANASAASTFSFPDMPTGGPAERHRIIAAMVVIGGTVANFSAAELLTQPFGDPTQVRLEHVLASDVKTSALASTIDLPNTRDQWGVRDQDYVFRVRSGAGGASTAALNLLVQMVPAGVAVPR